MKQIFILVIFILSLSVFSQDIVKDRGFFIGLNFSPDYCYRYWGKGINDLPDDQWEDLKNFIDSMQIPKLGYTIGANFCFQINNHINMESGINYSNKGYKTIPVLTIYDWNKPPIKATNIISYYYLDFPLRASYTFFDKRIQIIASGGMVLNLFLNSTTKIIPEGNTPSFKPTNFLVINGYSPNRINISPTVSVGIKYKINDRMNFRIEPVFSYGLLLFEEIYNTIHLWNAGVNIGYYIRL